MYYIGLDLSVNYSSYTITKDFDDFYFGSIINDTGLSSKKKDFFDDMMSTVFNFEVEYTNRSKKDSNNSYSENEREKLINYIEVSSKLINSIRKRIGFDSDCIVGIEGMSYGSKGMSTFDIPFLTGIIRRDILIDLLKSDVNRLFIFSPSELKNAIGCKGNAKKDKIFEAFIKQPIIPSLAEDDFYNYIKKNCEYETYIKQVNSKGEVHIGSPFNDIIDSTLPLLKIYNSLQ